MEDQVLYRGRDQVITEQTLIDPYAGYASCPDTQRAFNSYSNENQLQWVKKSELIVSEFIAKLPEFKDFKEAYAFLAKKRNEVAVELKQRNDEARTEYYGVFRKEEDHFRKIISAGDGEQYWKWQKNKVFELVYQLIQPAIDQHNSDKYTGYVYEDDYVGCLKQQVTVDAKEATYYSVTIKYPDTQLHLDHDKHLDTLSAIEVFDYVDNKKLNMVRIEYTPINNLEKYYINADVYYQLLLKWQPQEGLAVFFENAAKLAYLLAHLMLVKQGNVGIIEWMLRGVAFKNGIQLGQFNHSEGISWDFKAIFTPNRADYVKWFFEKAFYDYSMLNPDVKYKAFSYQAV
jgi:hypothetical protein